MLQLHQAGGRAFSQWHPAGSIIAGALLISSVGNWLECLNASVFIVRLSKERQCSGGGRS